MPDPLLTAKDRLKAARLAAGLEHDQVASALGINNAWYWDLESDATEIPGTLSLTDLRKLCEIVKISMRQLLLDTSEPAATPLTFETIRQSILRYMTENKSSLVAFEDLAGWELTDFMLDSFHASGWNIECLQDICRVLELDWTDAIS